MRGGIFNIQKTFCIFPLHLGHAGLISLPIAGGQTSVCSFEATGWRGFRIVGENCKKVSLFWMCAHGVRTNYKINIRLGALVSLPSLRLHLNASDADTVQTVSRLRRCRLRSLFFSRVSGARKRTILSATTTSPCA